jgi:hypothetical protein
MNYYFNLYLRFFLRKIHFFLNFNLGRTLNIIFKMNHTNMHRENAYNFHINVKKKLLTTAVLYFLQKLVCRKRCMQRC